MSSPVPHLLSAARHQPARLLPWPVWDRGGAVDAATVTVFRVPLSQPEAVVRRYRALLSPQEIQRADRYRLPHLGEWFAVCRGTLRSILGRLSDTSPEAVEFRYNRHGKPIHQPAPGGEAIQFSVSHSADLALIAVSPRPALGVDLERVERSIDFDRLAERFFAPDEVADLRRLADDLRRDAFFRCWTRKEAYIKALGTGLASPLGAFRVSVLPDQPPALLSVNGDADVCRAWRMFDLTPGPEFRASLLVSGVETDVSRYEWRH